MSIERKPKSPYQRYQKTPFRYSAEHSAWFAAAKAMNEGAMRQAGRKHSAMIERRFGPLDWGNQKTARSKLDILEPTPA